MPVTRAAERRSSMNKEKTTPIIASAEVKVETVIPKSPAVDSVYNESSLDSADSSFQSVKDKDNSGLIGLNASKSPIQDKKIIEDYDESSVDTSGLQSDDMMQSHELLGSTPLVSNSFSSTIDIIDQNRWLPLQRNVFLNEIQSAFLEKVYQLTPYLDSELKRKLSVKMNVHPEKVKMWFQNRRTKDRQFYRKQGKEPHWLTKNNRTKLVQSSMKAFISDMQFDFVSQQYNSQEAAGLIGSGVDASPHHFPFPVNSLSNQLQLNASIEHAANCSTAAVPPPPPSTLQFAKTQTTTLSSNVVLFNSLQDLSNIIGNQQPNCISQVFRNGELSKFWPNTVSHSGLAAQLTKLGDSYLKGNELENISQNIAALNSSSDKNNATHLSECGTPFTYNSELSEQDSKTIFKENVKDNSFGSNPVCFQSMSSYLPNQQKMNSQYYGSAYPYQHPNYSYPPHPTYSYPASQSSYGGYYSYSDQSMHSMMPAYMHTAPSMPRVAYSNYYPPQYKSYPYQSPHSYYQQQNYYPTNYRYNSIDMRSALPRIESFLSPQYGPGNHVLEIDYSSDTAQPSAQTIKSSLDWNNSMSGISNSTIAEESCSGEFNIDQIIGPLNSETNFTNESKFTDKMLINNAASLPEPHSESATSSL